MKTRTIIIFSSLALIATLFVPMQGNSQVEITVDQVKENMSKGDHTGFQVIIPQATLDDVRKDWIKEVQQGTKSKALDAGGEISIIGAYVKEISQEPIDIYSHIEPVDSSIKLVAFFVVDSVFVDPAVSGDGMVRSVEAYIRNFGVQEYEYAVENELKMEENKLKDLQKQLSDLQKNETKMEGSIRDEENNIKTSQEEIQILEAEKSAQLKAIEEKRVAASTMLDKDEKKAAESEIKTLEKERDKSDKSLAKENSSIADSQKNIEDYQKAIEEGKEQQAALEEQIEKQQEFVGKVQEKLGGIR